MCDGRASVRGAFYGLLFKGLVWDSDLGGRRLHFMLKWKSKYKLDSCLLFSGS